MESAASTVMASQDTSCDHSRVFNVGSNPCNQCTSVIVEQETTLKPIHLNMSALERFTTQEIHSDTEVCYKTATESDHLLLAVSTFSIFIKK